MIFQGIISVKMDKRTALYRILNYSTSRSFRFEASDTEEARKEWEIYYGMLVDNWKEEADGDLVVKVSLEHVKFFPLGVHSFNGEEQIIPISSQDLYYCNKRD